MFVTYKKVIVYLDFIIESKVGMKKENFLFVSPWYRNKISNLTIH